MSRSDSHTNFDGAAFSNGAGLAIAGVVGTVALAAHAAVRNHKDVIATGHAMASWEDLVESLSVRIAHLEDLNASLSVALSNSDEDMLGLVSENATLRQRLIDSGIDVD